MKNETIHTKMEAKRFVKDQSVTDATVEIKADDKQAEITITLDRKYYDFFKYKADYEKAPVEELILDAVKRSANSAKKYANYQH